jgi:hypothetical protein
MIQINNFIQKLKVLFGAETVICHFLIPLYEFDIISEVLLSNILNINTLNSSLLNFFTLSILHTEPIKLKQCFCISYSYKNIQLSIFKIIQQGLHICDSQSQ